MEMYTPIRIPDYDTTTPGSEIISFRNGKETNMGRFSFPQKPNRDDILNIGQETYMIGNVIGAWEGDEWIDKQVYVS